MSDNTLSTRSKTKPSPPQSDDVVELIPPAASGYSGTVKLFRLQHADVIAELLSERCGYTLKTEHA